MAAELREPEGLPRNQSVSPERRRLSVSVLADLQTSANTRWSSQAGGAIVSGSVLENIEGGGR